MKVARPVLRGRRRSNASPLPDQLSHAVAVRSAVFDDLSLVSLAGLVPAVALAARAGLKELADRHLSVPGGPGVAAGQGQTDPSSEGHVRNAEPFEERRSPGQLTG